MKKTFLKIIGGAALAILMVAMFAQVWVSAQNGSNEKQNEEQNEEQTDGEFVPPRMRTLEGSWSVQVTIRNCEMGAAVATFPAMSTFMQGGTMQEFSAGSSFLRGPGHGVWSHERGRRYSFAFQFFRFNADGTYAGLTRARRQVDLGLSRNSYTATAAIEVFNPAGVLVATACGTETATRFE